MAEMQNILISNCIYPKIEPIPQAVTLKSTTKLETPESSTSTMDANNVGMKMLKHMGYKPGKGLGKDESGIKSPIELEKPVMKGIGLGYKITEKHEYPLTNQIKAFIAHIKETISKEKENLEKMKNEHFRLANEKSPDLLPLFYKIKDQFELYEFSFSESFSYDDLERSAEFIIVLLDPKLKQLSQSSFDPFLDKSLLFLWKRCPFLKESHLNHFLLLFLKYLVESNWDDIFKWTSVLLDWKNEISPQSFNNQLYPLVYKKAIDVFESFSVNELIPLLALENETKSIESMLISFLENSNFIGTSEDASILCKFLSPTSFHQFCTISVAKSFDFDMDSFLRWHDFLGCDRLYSIAVNRIFPRLVSDWFRLFSERRYKECVEFYQRWRSRFQDCCIEKEPLRIYFFRLLSTVNKSL